ncbi:MAG TPA: hypothetical protein VFK71_04115 [Gaiellaceae bacterium]|nr:hypothetical protein [Gaiellaceae bacterium]
MESAETIWRPLGELLLEKGLVTSDELELALAEQNETGRLLGAILVDRGYVSGPALAVALAEQYGVELNTERGFGTGLWAEIDRRHRAGRGRGDGDEAEAEGQPERDNVVKLEPVAPRVEVVPDLVPEPDPELERLEAENRRLLEEIEELRVELIRPRLVEAPKQAFAHLLFVPTSARYLLLDRDGAPPAPGEELDVPEVEARFSVTKVGRAPYPGELRPCAYLLRLG